jgi:hypothetical protein
MTNDTAVFDAMRFDIEAGDHIWTRRVGTPEAIRRDALSTGGLLRYCPHEWTTVDLELANKHPYRRHGQLARA